MVKLSKSFEKIEQRKNSESQINKKIIELYLRALIQLIPGVGGAIEKVLFANIDAARQQDIIDLQNIILERLDESQIKIVNNSESIQEIVDTIQRDDVKFDLFIKRLSEIEILGDNLLSRLKDIDANNDIRYADISARMEALEIETKIERRMFVSADEYFSSNGSHLLDTNIAGIIRFTEYLKSYENFISSTSNIFLISGKGGNGKTHLLKEINNVKCNEYQLIYANIGLRDIEKAIQDELDTKEKYIIVVDDVDRNLNDLPTLFGLTKAYSNNIKLVLASRPAGLNSINKLLYNANLISAIDKIEIIDWSSEELLKLLQSQEVNKDKDEQLLIVKMYPNPFLIVWIGKNIRGEKSFSIKKIRKLFVNDIIKVAEENLEPYVDNPIDFLIDLAIIIPIYDDNSELKSAFAERYNVSIQIIKYAIDQLVSNGILRRVGTTIRFDPDMRGDLFLFYQFEDKSYELKARIIFEYWFRIYPEKVLINIQALSRYFNSQHIISFCSDIINEWIDNASITNGYDRIENLKLISHVAHLVPEESLNLIYTYIEIKQAATQRDDLFQFEPSSDDYGPIIISLIWKFELREQLLKLLLLLKEDKIGMYSNFKPDSLIREMVSPLKNSPSTIIKTLALLEDWAEDPSPEKITLIRYALEEVLGGSHETFKSYLNVFKIGEEVLIYNDDIVEMRERAFSLLRKLLKSDDIETIIIALKISRLIGSSKMGGGDLREIPLKDRIEEEHKRLVEIIGEMISKEKPFRIISEIEDLFLNWYASETGGTSNVVKYLLSFPRDTEYIVFNLFSNPQHAITDFEEIMNNAPASDKWRWMCENHFFRHKKGADPYFSKLAQELNNIYNSPTQICYYISKLERNISISNPWYHPPIITEWIKINKKVFSDIRSTSSLWKQIPIRFKEEIDIELFKQKPEHSKTVANEILSNIANINIDQLTIFLKILSISQIDFDELYGWLEQIVATNNIDCLDEIASRIYFIFEIYEEPTKHCEIVINILEPFDEQKLSLINRLSLSIDLLIKNRNNIDSQYLDTLKGVCRNYLYNMPRLNYDTEAILYFSFLNNIEDFVEFLIYRIKRERKHYKGFRSIPDGGFHKLNLIVDTLDKFLIFFEGLHRIRQEITFGGLHLQDLNANVKNLVNKSTNKQFVLEHIEALVKVEDYVSSLEFLPYLNEPEKNLDIILLVASNSILNGYENKVIDVYDSLCLGTKTVFGTQDLKKCKEFFIKLSDKISPGLHKKIVIDKIRRIDKNINSMERNDDYYTPRG